MGATRIAKQRMFAQESAQVDQGTKFVEALKEWNPFGLNIMFATLSGDIGQQTTGLLPKRVHDSDQGAFAKLANKKENMWNGVITADDLPSVINPESGYLVSTGSQIDSHLSLKALRISEQLKSLIAGAGEKLIRVKDIQ